MEILKSLSLRILSKPIKTPSLREWVLLGFFFHQTVGVLDVP